MISTDLYYAKDQYDKRQEMWWSYWETPRNFTLYGMIGLAILKSKLDAKIEKAQSYPVKDLTLWNMYT